MVLVRICSYDRWSVLSCILWLQSVKRKRSWSSAEVARRRQRITGSDSFKLLTKPSETRTIGFSLRRGLVCEKGKSYRSELVRIDGENHFRFSLVLKAAASDGRSLKSLCTHQTIAISQTLHFVIVRIKCIRIESDFGLLDQLVLDESLEFVGTEKQSDVKVRASNSSQ